MIYIHVLPELSKIKSHDKATEALSVLSKFGIDEHMFENMILENDEIEGLRVKYLNKKRKKIEHEWKYGSILQKIISADSKYYGLIPTYVQYMLSSHTVHYGGNAVISRLEKMAQNHEKNDALAEIYKLKIISNILNLFAMRVQNHLLFKELSLKKVSPYIIEVLNICSDIEKYSNQEIFKK